jgi:hypothetical protein
MVVKILGVFFDIFLFKHVKYIFINFDYKQFEFKLDC